MRRRFDARMIQPGWRLPDRHSYGQRRGNFDGTHAVAFAVALEGVETPEEEMRSLLVDAQQYVLPDVISCTSRLPPCGPLSTVRTAPCTGATPITPIIGFICSFGGVFPGATPPLTP